jgi:hypothetical protein
MKSKREILFDLQDEMFAKCKEIIRVKNSDYANGDDPYINFRSSEIFGVSPVTGIMLRAMDKFQRVATFDKNGKLSVKDESVLDALLDILNYVILIAGYINDKQENKCNTHQLLNPLPSPKKKTSTTRSQYRLDGAIQTKPVNLVSK